MVLIQALIIPVQESITQSLSSYLPSAKQDTPCKCVPFHNESVNIDGWLLSSFYFCHSVRSTCLLFQVFTRIHTQIAVLRSYSITQH